MIVEVMPLPNGLITAAHTAAPLTQLGEMQEMLPTLVAGAGRATIAGMVMTLTGAVIGVVVLQTGLGPSLSE